MDDHKQFCIGCCKQLTCELQVERRRCNAAMNDSLRWMRKNDELAEALSKERERTRQLRSKAKHLHLLELCYTEEERYDSVMVQFV